LQCDPPGTGEHVGTDTFNACPVIDPLVAVPLEAVVNASVSVSAQATDAEGDALGYSWTSNPADAFSAPTSPQTDFTCQSCGSTVLTVSVNDGKGCTESKSITVSCLPVIHGR